VKYIPGMTPDRAWELTNQVHYEGQAIVWTGPQEQAEFYHQQLSRAGLTMAPLEAA
jgi:ATP-dependent Clp protease adaptor protein ClpS